MDNKIIIRGARLHNLKNISLELPKYCLIVVTGLSGSGKSSLAFDTLHKEGQRQYLESLGMVTDQLVKPSVDSISGLAPSISVDQHNANHNPRSTVGTATEVFTYLRVLFAKLGSRPCPHCGKTIPPSFLPGEMSLDEVDPAEDPIACPGCGNPVPQLSMTSFSFNKPAGACPLCTGLGVIADANITELIDESKSILNGAVHGWDQFFIDRYAESLHNAGKHYGFLFDPAIPINRYSPIQKDLLLYGVEHPTFKRHVPDTKPPKTVPCGRFEGIATNILRRFADHAQDADYRAKMAKFLVEHRCPDCEGTRLRLESRQVVVSGKTIIDAVQLPFDRILEWLSGLKPSFQPEAKPILEPILDDLCGRVQRLVDVGVGYLTLDRATPSLSAGEAQRLRLASLLGSGLTGVLYVLDEPTIGLHPRDTEKLIRVLQRLRDLGNTLLIIEHDLDMLRVADYVVDVGPGAGRQGGRIVAQGTPHRIAECAESLTGKYLSGRLSLPSSRNRKTDGYALWISGAREHNLKNLSVRLPLECLLTVTGVSGSGKSSLMFDILDRAAREKFFNSRDLPGAHDRIEGWEYIDKVITIDQMEIGRSSRSNAATYTDTFQPIRDVFASQEASKNRKFTSRHFSFNVPGGRCERCEGAGVLTIPMHFLPDALVRCPVCRGRRFQHEVLDVKFKGLDIAEVLDLTIEEALEVFQDIPAVAARLLVLSEVGLGYLQLGQPTNTLSGGEAQRVKLSTDLSRRSVGRTLYLLDEPSTGLHSADVHKLIDLLQRLVDAGHSVMVVEHNLELIRAADWIIDLGPDGGEGGGNIIAEGTPESIACLERSETGKFLSAKMGNINA